METSFLQRKVVQKGYRKFEDRSRHPFKLQKAIMLGLGTEPQLQQARGRQQPRCTQTALARAQVSVRSRD